MTTTDIPETISLVAMGTSHLTYTANVAHLGSRKKLSDETWAINCMGNVIYHDRLFFMHDIKTYSEQQAKSGVEQAQNVLSWLKHHPGPVYTIKAYPDEYPGTVAYPLEDVLTSVGQCYLNNTAAYALALAIHMGVKQIGIFGCDFSYKNMPHFAEAGRACMEYLLGMANARNIRIQISDLSYLFSANCSIGERFYGYGELVEHIGWDNGQARVAWKDAGQTDEEAFAPKLTADEVTADAGARAGDGGDG